MRREQVRRRFETAARGAPRRLPNVQNSRPFHADGYRDETPSAFCPVCRLFGSWPETAFEEIARTASACELGCPPAWKRLVPLDRDPQLDPIVRRVHQILLR